MGERMQRKRNFFNYDSLLKKNHRGLSAIVTTLIIILLAIVAVGAVWVVISNVISEGSGDINLERFTLDIAIKSAYVDGSDIGVKIRRSAGKGEIKGLNFVFSDGSDSIVIRRDIVLKELEERTFIFNSTEIAGIVAGDTVSIAPIFDSSGSEKTGEVTDTEKISSIVPPGGGGGSGGNGGGGTPECSDGSDNDGDGSIDLADAGCIDADDTDETNCGDGVCEGGETSGTCSLDCSGGTPSTCGNGVFDVGLEECDGTPTPNGCSAATCSCEAGFTADGFGGCSLNSAVNTGTINSVWNKIYIDSEDFPKSQVAMVGYLTSPPHSINFSGSPEVACFAINFADFVSETNISYVRLDDSLGFPNVSPGEGYFVWEAELCGA